MESISYKIIFYWRKKFKYDSSYLKQKQIMENDLSYWESIRD